MSGIGIYVLELQPTNCVKVGQTTNFVRRLRDHTGNSAMYGVAITRSSFIAVDDPEAVEEKLLDTLKSKPGVSVAGGNETFKGVSFDSVLRVVSVCAGLTPPSPAPVASDVKPVDVSIVEIYGEGRDLLVDVAESLGAESIVRVTDVVARLRALAPNYLPYRKLDGTQLIEALRAEGVEVKMRNGYFVLRADRVRVALGSWLVARDSWLATGV